MNSKISRRSADVICFPVKSQSFQVSSFNLLQLRAVDWLILIFLTSFIGMLAVVGRPYMAVASVSFFCLVLGLIFRFQRLPHVVLMNLGIFLDLAIVVTLELNRHAVETAVEFNMGIFHKVHIGTSLIATLLYFPVIILGVLRFLGRGSENLRKNHIKLGLTAFIFRALGFVFMFSLFWKS